MHNGVLTVVQARTGSSRLPGKVLKPLGRATVLECLLERLDRARLRGTIVVATTTDPADEEIARLCRRAGVRCYRGHPTDLLDRHYRVALAHGAQHVVKIPSDCPLIDPAIVDRVLQEYLADPEAYDYVSNLHPQSYPDGNDVEVMSFRALARAWRNAFKPHEREHTTPYLWDQPDLFRCGNVARAGDDLSRSHRVVLDYPEDYEVIRRIYDALSPRDPSFGADAIVQFLDEHPDVAARNARHRGVNWYRHHLRDLRTVNPGGTRGDALEQR